MIIGKDNSCCKGRLSSNNYSKESNWDKLPIKTSCLVIIIMRTKSSSNRVVQDNINNNNKVII